MRYNVLFRLIVPVLMATSQVRGDTGVDVYWFPDGGQEGDGILTSEPFLGKATAILFCLYSDHTYSALSTIWPRKLTKRPLDLLAFQSYYDAREGYWDFQDGNYRLFLGTDRLPPPITSSSKPLFLISNKEDEFILKRTDGSTHRGIKFSKQTLPPNPNWTPATFPRD